MARGQSPYGRTNLGGPRRRRQSSPVGRRPSVRGQRGSRSSRSALRRMTRGGKINSRRVRR